MGEATIPELVRFEGETLGETLTNLLNEIQRLRRFSDRSLQNSLLRLERLRELGISDPVWEQEYGKDEYTGETLE